MDKWTLNMIAGALLSALLVVVAASTFVDIFYPTGGGPEESGGHGGEATAARDAPSDASSGGAPAVSFAALLTQASAEAGSSQAKKCAACHTFDEGGANKVGPNLHGIVGRAVASHEGFAYSNALKEYGGNWDYEKLSCYIENPKSCVPGNKMSFAGVKSDKDRADVIAYLRSVSPNAPPLPAAAEAAAPAPAAGQNGTQPAAEATASPGASATEAAAPAHAAGQNGTQPAVEANPSSGSEANPASAPAQTHN